MPKPEPARTSPETADPTPGRTSAPTSDGRTVVAFPLGQVADALAPPRPELDPVLDATFVCLAAHGISRTSMADIAREMGVSRSTVYRQIGSVEHAAWLLAAREVWRFFADAPRTLAGAHGPQVATRLIAAALRAAADNPVMTKILRDESDFVGRSISRDLPTIIDRGVVFLTPMLTVLIDGGTIRHQDPAQLAGTILRVGIGFLLAPLPDDLDTALDTLLTPMLTP